MTSRAACFFFLLLVALSAAGPVFDAYTTTQDDHDTKTPAKHNPSWGPASTSRTTDSGVAGSVSNINIASAGKWRAETGGSLSASARVTYEPPSALDISGYTSLVMSGDSGANAFYSKMLLSVTDGIVPNSFYPSSNTTDTATWDISDMDGWGTDLEAITKFDWIARPFSVGIGMNFSIDFLSSN